MRIPRDVRMNKHTFDLSVATDTEFCTAEGGCGDAEVRVYPDAPHSVALQIRGMRGSQPFYAHTSLSQQQLNAVIKVLQKARAYKFGGK